MAKLKIFISSVQQEFALERQSLHDYILAEPMYLKGYIDRMGTGTADIVRIACENNLKEPEFEQQEDFKTIIFRPITHQVPTKYPSSTHQVPTKHPPSKNTELTNLIKVLDGEMSRQELQELLGLKDKRNFRENYLNPAIETELIKMKYPEKPTTSKQKYFLTEKGEQVKVVTLIINKK